MKPDVVRQMQGRYSSSGGGNANTFNPSNMTGEDLVLESIILDKNGEPTDRWTISERRRERDYPTHFPDGWLSGMLVYPDDTPIAPSDMVEELRKTRKPLNWVRAIITLIEKRITRQSRSAYEKNNDVLYENSRNIAANEKELARVSSEIERAKREGNVADEERLKVQMTRLTDERTTLNTLRRELELSLGNEHAVLDEGLAPKTPGYSSILDDSPVAGAAGGGGGAEDANRLRGAVATFNEKMLEKYGNDDENIPSTSEPSTPRSPAYSSIFENEDDQRGGGRRGGSGNNGQTGKFIPQIPTGVLESYLNSRHPGLASMAPLVSPFQQMGGGSGGSNLGSNMTMMNVPVVATMPMAGMMPIQGQVGGQPVAGQVAPGQVAPGQVAPGQVAPGQTPAQAAGPAQVGGAPPSSAPNASGVRAFTIKY